MTVEVKKQYGKNDFTPAEVDIIVRAARQTWDEIAPDILQNSEKKMFCRSEVIGIVSDADFMFARMNYDRDLYTRWTRASDAYRTRVMRDAFSASYYGQ